MSLRVALVCPYSLSRPGGVQGQVMGLARRLRTAGIEATVFAPVDDTAKNGPLSSGDPDGDGHDRVDVVATGRSVPIPANGSRAPITISPLAVARAVRTIRTGRYDLVHVHEPFTPGVPYGLLAARGLPPLVATFHRSGSSPFYTLLSPLSRPVARRRIAVRCVVSEAARQTATRALGGTFRVGFNGIEVDRFAAAAPWPTEERAAVLFLGRHEARKGLPVLLDAFASLRGRAAASEQTPGSPVLWVAGDGPETDRLRRRHPDSSDVRWLGVITEQEKYRRLVAATIVVAPSLGGESFGMVLLEAMAARALVVASDIAGYRDAAGGHAALVPPGDVSALADALSADLAAAGGCMTSGPRADEGDGPPGRRLVDRLDAGQAWAGRWSMERLAAWYGEIYRNVVGGL